MVATTFDELKSKVHDRIATMKQDRNAAATKERKEKRKAKEAADAESGAAKTKKVKHANAATAHVNGNLAKGATPAVDKQVAPVKPAETKDDAISFSKIKFADGTVVKDFNGQQAPKAAKAKLNPKQALQKLEAKQARTQHLAVADPEKAAELKE